MELRPYQQAAREAVEAQWGAGIKRTLLVLPTGCGKTIVFAKVTEDVVKHGSRVLILAHRGELLEQAADKLLSATGLSSVLEKAESSSLGALAPITVGSVQTLMRESRLQKFEPNHFNHIIVDEAHHVLSDGYQRILNHFAPAKVLGVTATPDRGDMRNLGSFFESLAYEYTLPEAIREGYLCPVKALTIPLKIDMRHVGVSQGDFKANDISNALDPYLEQIADEMVSSCKGRKTVVFLPLISTSQKFRDILEDRGFRAAEVNGESSDRKEVLEAFDRGEYDVLCNSMLLTEGWDCPSVDCIVVLRPTKIRSLYCQMVGRGTRLNPGKKDLLLLDFLWHTERHELCRPAYLICENDEVAKKMTENLENGEATDLIEAEEGAKKDVLTERENALAATLEEMTVRNRKLVDPLQFEMSIQAIDLADYMPTFKWEAEPPTEKQKAALVNMGILPDKIDSKGKAVKMIDRLVKRAECGLSTPKQIALLERRGFKHVGSWSKDQASRMIGRLHDNNWRMPRGLNPETYIPEAV